MAKWLKVAFTLIWMLTIGTGYSAWSILSYASYSNEDKADGIIVLGAATYGNQPSPVFKERINHAINLYKEGYANIIIFTGGKGDDRDLSEAEVAKQYAIEHGIVPDNILVETLSKSTEQNLCFAKQLVISYHFTTLIIVSDPLHMKRAMLIADDIGLKAYTSPTPTTQYKSFITRIGFLIRETYYYQRYLLRRLLFYQCHAQNGEIVFG
jgi:uncharacterized SAM-binding protein YcdF (DUF218 family)